MPTKKEEALFRRSVRERRERGLFRVEGKDIHMIGKRLSIELPPELAGGRTLESSLHTHPISRIALLSRKDVESLSIVGGEGAKHAVLGEKFPLTNRFLRSIGQEPEPIQVVKNVFSQEQLKNVEYSKIPYKF